MVPFSSLKEEAELEAHISDLPLLVPSSLSAFTSSLTSDYLNHLLACPDPDYRDHVSDHQLLRAVQNVEDSAGDCLAMLEQYSRPKHNLSSDANEEEAADPFASFQMGSEWCRMKDELELLTGREDLERDGEGGRKSRLYLRAARSVRLHAEIKGQ